MTYRKRKNDTTIKQLWMESSGACNLNCIMCGGNPRKKEFNNGKAYMSLDKFKYIVDEFIKLSNGNLMRIDFRGTGEPLMNEKVADMVAYCTDRGLKKGITTNGLLLNNDIVLKLLNNKLDTLTLSIESVRKDTYEIIRRGSNLESVKENIERLADNIEKLGSNCKIQFNVVLSKYNLNQMEDIIKYAARINVDNVSILNLENSERKKKGTIYKENKIYGITIDKMKKKFRKWEKVAKENKIKIYIPPIIELKDRDCPFNWSAPMITCDGYIFPCCRMQEFKYSLGNMYEEKITSIWNNNKYLDFRMGNNNFCNFCLKYLDRFENMYWLK